MKKSVKVKSKIKIGSKRELEIFKDWGFYNKQWEWREVKTIRKYYNYKVSFKTNKYMKLWDDLELKLKIHKKIGKSLNHKEILWSFTDIDNSVDFSSFNKFMKQQGWQSSNLSGIKNKFISEWFIKKSWDKYYFNPIVWIKSKEINPFLLELFERELQEYWVLISFS